MTSPQVNSESYWDKRFRDDWNQKHGPEQTRFFARLALDHLPAWLETEIRTQQLSVVDFGCATGDAIPLLAKALGTTIEGVDFSTAGLELARAQHPGFKFSHVSDAELPGEFDVLFSSNTLEHHAEPYAILSKLLKKTRKYAVLLLPFQEEEATRIKEHLFTFSLDNIPLGFEGFRLLGYRVLDGAPLRESEWRAQQILLVYGREGAVDLNSIALTDSTIADGREASAEIKLDDYRRSLADAFTERDALRKSVEELRETNLELSRNLAEQTFALHSARKDLEQAAANVAASRYALHRARGQLEAFRVSVRHKLIQVIHSAKFRPGKTAMSTAKWAAGLYKKKGVGLVGGLEADDSILPIAQELSEADRLLGVSRPTLLAKERGAALKLSSQRNGLISVVLPVYNQADLLEESIHSVLTQTWERLELIIVNDGSTDGVERVLEKFVDDPRVIILSGANQKLPNALNSGFARASGEFWTWTSADNIMLPNQLEVLAYHLKAHDEWAMVYSDYQAIDDRGAPLHNPQFRAHNQDPKDTSLIRLPTQVTEANLHDSGDNFIGASFLYRRSAAVAVGQYVSDTFGGEDYDFWLRIHALFEIGHVPQILYKYRVHDNTLNAKAAKLGLFENVQRLLKRDRERRQKIKETVEFRQVGLALPLPGFGTVPVAIVAYSKLGTPAAIELLSKDHALAICVVDVSPDAVAPARLSDFDLVVTRSEQTWNIIDAELQNKALLLNIDEHPELFHQIVRYRAFERQFNKPTYRLLPEFKKPEHRKLHVALQTRSMDKGGLEQVIATLSGNLDPENFDVSVIVEEQEIGEIGGRLRERGIKVFPVGRDLNQLEHTIRRAGIDLINLHHSLFGCELYERLGIPVVYTLHNSYTWLSNGEAEARRVAFARMQSFIAVSRQVANYASARFKLDAEKTQVVPNGLARDHFEAPVVITRSELGLSDDDYVFINVASLNVVKGQHSLLSAIRELRVRHQHAKLILVGADLDPPLTEEFRKRIHQEKLEGHVLLLGHQSHARIDGLLSLSDAFVLPSIHEGWSIALMEAQAHGLPAIVTNTGAAEEVVGASGSGIVVGNAYPKLELLTSAELASLGREYEPRNTPQLIAAMDQFITAPKKWKARGEAGARFVKQFTAEAQARTYEKVFRETWGRLRPETWSARAPVAPVHQAQPAPQVGFIRQKLNQRAEKKQRTELEKFAQQYKSKRIVVSPPVIEWNVPIYQRPQHLALQLAKLGHPYFFSTHATRFDKVEGTQKIGANCYLTNRYDVLVSLKQPKTYHLISTDLNWFDRERARDWKFIKHELDAGTQFIYEYIDEIHPAISSIAIPRDIYDRHDSILADERIKVVATATKLYDEVAQHRSTNFELVTNGVDFEHFSRRFTTPPPEMKPFVKGDKPIIGYFGALADWFDYELVLKMAEKRDWHIVLIGFDYDGSLRRYGFDKAKNPKFLGPIPYQQLPHYASFFDVATIPFRVNEITESTSPIKLFEYMAMGKPIVTTNMPECRKYKSVHVARNHNEFLKLIDEAIELKNDSSHQELLRADALANTWESKARMISALMNR